MTRNEKITDLLYNGDLKGLAVLVVEEGRQERESMVKDLLKKGLVLPEKPGTGVYPLSDSGKKLVASGKSFDDYLMNGLE